MGGCDPRGLSPEVVQAKAVQFLVDGNEMEEAEILLFCEFDDLDWFEDSQIGVHGNFESVLVAHLTIEAPRPLYDSLRAQKSRQYPRIQRALKAVIESYGCFFHGFEVKAGIADPGPQWRTDLLQAIEGKAIHNQAITDSKVTVWKGMRFRSPAEMRVAQALEEARVLYLPNCKAALGIEHRENREPDFLICHNGKWGILEVDGETFHPPTRTVQDHERDRLFRQHGIRVVEHFNWDECIENAPGVVKRFLQILEQAY